MDLTLFTENECGPMLLRMEPATDPKRRENIENVDIFAKELHI